jgi:hypothetical protein
MNFISIYDIKNHKINPIFIKGCNLILEKHNSLFNEQLTNFEKNKLLSDFWSTEFNAELVLGNVPSVPWEKIVFPDQLTMTLFLIKLT